MSYVFHRRKHWWFLSPHLLRTLSNFWHSWLSFLETLPSLAARSTPSLIFPMLVLAPASLSLSDRGEQLLEEVLQSMVVLLGTAVLASAFIFYLVILCSVSSISVTFKTICKLTNPMFISPVQTSLWTLLHLSAYLTFPLTYLIDIQVLTCPKVES